MKEIPYVDHFLPGKVAVECFGKRYTLSPIIRDYFTGKSEPHYPVPATFYDVWTKDIDVACTIALLLKHPGQLPPN